MWNLKDKAACFYGSFLFLMLWAGTAVCAQQRHVRYTDPVFGTIYDYDIYRYPALVTIEGGKYNFTPRGIEPEKAALAALTALQSNNLEAWRKLNTEKVSPEQFKFLQQMMTGSCQLFYHISYENFEVFVFYPKAFPLRFVLPFKKTKGIYKIDRSFSHSSFAKMLSHNNFDPFVGEKVYNMKCLAGFESMQGTQMDDYSGYQAIIKASKSKFTGSDYGQGILVDQSAVSLAPAKDDPLFQNTFQVNAKVFVTPTPSAKPDTALILSTVDRGKQGFMNMYTISGPDPLRLYIVLKDKPGKRYHLTAPIPGGKWFAFSISYAFSTAKVYIDKELKAEIDIGSRFDYEQASFMVGKNAGLAGSIANAKIDELVIGFE